MSEMTTPSEPLQRRKPGRPPKVVGAEEQGPVARRASRDGRAQVTGRDGTVLSRRRSGNTDPYAVPPHIIPTGWRYQWNAVTVHGNADPVQNQMQSMWLNGWRAVPAERHDGMFMPTGVKGEIMRGGLRLEERPAELDDEARAEDKEIAVAQMRDQNAQFGLGNRLGRGFDERKFAGHSRAAGAGVRTGVEVVTDAPRPQYEIDKN